MRFLVDGERVQETDTPESVRGAPTISVWRAITAHTLSLAMPVQLELEDQDQIDAMVRQEGGRQ